MSNTKRCSRCQQILPHDVFNKKASTPSGLNSSCRTCANQMKRTLTPKQRARKNYLKRAWDAANPDKVKAMNAKAYEANPELFINNAYLRYARIKNNDRRLVTKQDIAKIYLQPCIYCSSTKQIELDHIIPIARGGRHAIGNIAPACRSCNRNKSDLLVMEWRKKRETP